MLGLMVSGLEDSPSPLQPRKKLGNETDRKGGSRHDSDSTSMTNVTNKSVKSRRSLEHFCTDAEFEKSEPRNSFQGEANDHVSKNKKAATLTNNGQQIVKSRGNNWIQAQRPYQNVGHKPHWGSDNKEFMKAATSPKKGSRYQGIEGDVDSPRIPKSKHSLESTQTSSHRKNTLAAASRSVPSRRRGPWQVPGVVASQNLTMTPSSAPSQPPRDLTSSKELHDPDTAPIQERSGNRHFSRVVTLPCFQMAAEAFFFRVPTNWASRYKIELHADVAFCGVHKDFQFIYLDKILAALVRLAGPRGKCGISLGNPRIESQKQTLKFNPPPFYAIHSQPHVAEACHSIYDTTNLPMIQKIKRPVAAFKVENMNNVFLQNEVGLIVDTKGLVVECRLRLLPKFTKEMLDHEKLRFRLRILDFNPEEDRCTMLSRYDSVEWAWDANMTPPSNHNSKDPAGPEDVLIVTREAPETARNDAFVFDLKARINKLGHIVCPTVEIVDGRIQTERVLWRFGRPEGFLPPTIEYDLTYISDRVVGFPDGTKYLLLERKQRPTIYKGPNRQKFWNIFVPQPANQKKIARSSRFTSWNALFAKILVTMETLAVVAVVTGILVAFYSIIAHSVNETRALRAETAAIKLHLLGVKQGVDAQGLSPDTMMKMEENDFGGPITSMMGWLNNTLLRRR